MDKNIEENNILTQPAPSPQEEWIRQNRLEVTKPGVMETLGVGISSAIQTLPTRSLLSKFVDDNIRYTPDQLAEVYPNVPSEVFGKPDKDGKVESLSALKAHYLYNEYAYNQHYQNIKNLGEFGSISSGLMDLGSGIVASFTDPLLMSANIAGGAGAEFVAAKVLSKMPAMAAARLSSSTMFNIGVEFGGNVLGGMAYEYPARKFTRDFTNRDYTLGDVAVESAMGAAGGMILKHLSSAVASRLFKKDVDVRIAEDLKDADIRLKDAYDKLRETPNVAVPLLEYKTRGFMEVIQEAAYNKASKGDINYRGTYPVGSTFGLYTGSFDSHFAPTTKINGTVALNSDVGMIEGMSDVLKTSGDIFYVETGGLNIISEDNLIEMIKDRKIKYVKAEPHDELTSLDQIADIDLKNIFASLTKKSNIHGIYRDINPSVKNVELQEGAKRVVHIFEDVYQGLKKEKMYRYGDAQQRLTYNYTTDQGVPLLGAGDSKYARLHSVEGYSTNGKKIDLSRDGYFRTEPLIEDDFITGDYIEVFSKNHIDEISKAVDEVANPVKISEQYKYVTESMARYAADLKTFSDMLDQANRHEESIKVFLNPRAHIGMSKKEFKMHAEGLGLKGKEIDAFRKDLDSLLNDIEKNLKNFEGKEYDEAYKALNDLEFKEWIRESRFEEEVSKKLQKKYDSLMKTLKNSNFNKTNMQKVMRKQFEFEQLKEKLAAKNPDMLEKLIRAYENCLRNS